MLKILALTFLLTFILGKIFIPLLTKFKIGQIVRDDGPKEHLKKTGTPTMGGIIFIIPIILFSLITDINNPLIVASVLLIFFSSLVGFFDDYLKIKRKNKDGLKPWFKTGFFVLISLVYGIYIAYFTELSSNISVPFTRASQVFTIPPWLYVLFIMLFYNALINAVNFTDGVDGLCGSVTAFVFLFFGLVSFFVFKDLSFTNHSFIIVAALIGYLIFNLHPAKLLMGDTGSLALGAAVSSVSISLKIPWIIIIVGFIYVIEILSSIIQVLHYKRTKKRVFLMAPIHHHFELKKWSENKIVLVFSGITILGGIISYLIL